MWMKSYNRLPYLVENHTWRGWQPLERERSPMGGTGQELNYSLRGRGCREDSPSPSLSPIPRDASYGMPMEGIVNTEEENGTLSTLGPDTSRSDTSETGQSDQKQMEEQEERAEVEEESREVDMGGEEHMEDSTQADEQQERALEDESVQADGEKDDKQRQEPLTDLVRQERAETGRAAILKEGECYETKLNEGMTADPVLWWKGHQVWALEQGTKGGVCGGSVEGMAKGSGGEWGRCTKEPWIVIGELMSRKFSATVTMRKTTLLMTVMNHPFDEHQSQQRTTRGILKCVVDFYRQLLTEEDQWTSEAKVEAPEQEVWRHVRDHLDLESTLEEDIEPEEVERAIAELPRLKARGWTTCLWKDFQIFYVILLTVAYNEALKFGVLPRGFADVFIILLYKKGAKDDVCNWHPISILNAMYKILAKVVATGLKEVLLQIVDTTQTGFVAGQQILSTVTLVQQILEKAQCTGCAQAFVSIDLEKGYGRIRWKFLLQGMARRGIGGIYRGWVRTLLT
ncbi:hypothetical protein CBR_g31396 [Chara braunii]|uniref:Reverse transcriptase domain-containing protein n=1 Tax=Chara braunii TaxID=69332 RepID=A0A388LEU9_CHABU|nr:hypothetical protein CBR_g31396 [Chara braunii]|eukprot:GBG80840.1 hypothetical protein CBR_g31396 [Chara braunii]